MPIFRYCHEAARIEIFLHNAFVAARSGLDDTRRAAEWPGSVAELIVLIAEAALAKSAIPLLPGLVPGAPPDDEVAYRLWVADYDGPAGLPTAKPGQQLVYLLMKAGDTEAEAVEHSIKSLTTQTRQNWEL